MHALCVSGAVNTQGFVWGFLIILLKKFMRSIQIFIHLTIRSFSRSEQLVL